MLERTARRKESCMSDQFEVDTDELVEQLGEHQRLTGTSPGRVRRNEPPDLLLRGGAAPAAGPV